ncbi:MAG TPA: MFS transporter [Candidatus Limnocylindria bacterium]|nr:MFS transporter [Candidatus Limnocylindria bacterium]
MGLRPAGFRALTAVPLAGTQSGIPRRARLAAYAAVFLAFFDNFALLPLIAPRAQELGADALGVGVAVAAYSLTNLFLNLLGGSLADRVGRRRVLLVSLAVSPICIAIYGLADSLPVFLAARAVHGAFGGFLTASLFALLADLAPEGERGKTIGRAGALIGAAAVIGPAAAGVAARELGSGPVFLAVAAIIAVGLIVVRGAIPETLPPPARSGAPGTWRRLLADPRLRVAFLAIFALEAGVGVVTGFLKDGIVERQMAVGMDAERALRYATGAQGGLFSIFALVAVILMLSPIARRVDRRGAFGLSLAGLACLAASTAIMAVGGTLVTDSVAMVLYGVGFGLLFPAAAGMVGIAAPAPERGRAYGVFNFSFDAGLAAGPLLAGVLAVSTLAVEPFITATALIVLVAVLIPLAARTRGSAEIRGDRVA